MGFSETQREVTIGVLSAIPDVENQAVLAAFGITKDQEPTQVDGCRYWIGAIERSEGVRLRIIISCIAGSGNVEPQIPVERMNREFKLETIFFVGIACGIRKLQLADVVTSDVIWAYEYAKTQADADLDRSRAKSSPRALTKDVEFFKAHDEWHSLFNRTLADFSQELLPKERRIKPTLTPSTWIASGEKVMADGELARLNEQHDRIRAGEMEGYGFALACETQSPPIPWLVIRGISDYGDASKDGKPTTSSGRSRDDKSPEKDEYHIASAVAAATFLRIFLEKSYSPPLITAHRTVVSSEPGGKTYPGTLSDRQIKLMVANGLLISEDYAEENVQQACYELRVGDVYYELGANKVRRATDELGYVLLKPGQLTAVITKETLKMPDDILGRILTKGLLFSVGILPINTYADPGFEGKLGIVLYNVSNNYLKLTPNIPIAKIEFSRLAEPVERTYSGQHGYQTKIWPIPEDLVLPLDAVLPKDRQESPTVELRRRLLRAEIFASAALISILLLLTLIILGHG